MPAANSGPGDNQVSGIGMIKGDVHQAEPVGLAALIAAVGLVPAANPGLDHNVIGVARDVPNALAAADLLAPAADPGCQP